MFYFEPQLLLPSQDIILPFPNPLPCYLLLLSPITQDLSILKNKNKTDHHQNCPLATNPSSQSYFWMELSAQTIRFLPNQPVLGANTGCPVHLLQSHFWVLVTAHSTPLLCPLRPSQSQSPGFPLCPLLASPAHFGPIFLSRLQPWECLSAP